MKTESIKKINKMGKVGQILSRIWFVFACIGVAGCLLGTIIVMILPNDFVKYNMSGEATMEVDARKWVNADDVDAFYADGGKLDGEQPKLTVGTSGASIELTDMQVRKDGKILFSGQGNLYSFQFAKVKYAMIFITLSLVCVAVTAWFACRICKELKVCETPFEDKIIKNIQYLAYSIIPWCIFDNVDDMFGALMFRNGNIPVSINCQKILVCLIILAIAYIFKYGAQLQREADETL